MPSLQETLQVDSVSWKDFKAAGELQYPLKLPPYADKPHTLFQSYTRQTHFGIGAAYLFYPSNPTSYSTCLVCLNRARNHGKDSIFVAHSQMRAPFNAFSTGDTTSIYCEL
ncbi:hypothetical protein CDAR_33831 [Caerostris darwini]|uniref:Uncharacterized protein n=1 Tax=Caerostris darwini TaxID=1538125 RepID=A0AAV4WB91_9ARAC|nr:hypothetical protein CDAR_33831 [Caerostris darwini]